MVMWNLVGYGAKWAARGIDAFSRTEVGKKTAEISAKSFNAAKEASREAIDNYKASKQSHTNSAGTSRGGSRWVAGSTVVTHDGRLGTVVRYLQVNEIGGSMSDTSLTELVMVDLAQWTNEFDRYLMVHEDGLRAI